MMKTRRPTGLNRGLRAQRGQSFVEYLVVVGVLAAVLMSGSPSPFQQLFAAFGDAFQGYSNALAYSTVPNCSQHVRVPDFDVNVSVDVCPDPTNLRDLISVD